MTGGAPIVGDAEFTAFQSKLATVVANARARGLQITRAHGDGRCCPLGAHPDAEWSHPPSYIARATAWTEVDQQNLRKFINGYDGGDAAIRDPYWQLGAQYRAVFP